LPEQVGAGEVSFATPWALAKSSTTTNIMSLSKYLPFIHPCEILLEEFIMPMSLSQNEAWSYINGIIKEAQWDASCRWR
jgi:hypothetical protein